MTTYGYVQPAKMWIAFRDSNGYPMGALSTPDSPANGTVYGAYVLDNLVEFSTDADTQPQVTFENGGTRKASVYSAGATKGNVTVTLNTFDPVLYAYLTKTSVDSTTNTTHTITTDNPRQGATPRFIIGFNMKTVNIVTGQAVWETRIYPNVIFKQAGESGGADVTGDVRNPNNLTYIVTPSESTRSASGELFANMNTGSFGGVAMVERWNGSYPLHLTTYVDDGSAGTFTLPYKPVLSTATGTAGNNITTNGAQSTVDSVNTGTGVVTRTATTATDKIVLLTGTEYVPTS